MFLNLQAPVPKAAALMKKLRLEAIDPNTGAMRDIVDILGDFNKATAKMGKAQKSAAIDTIFGKRAIAGVSVLLAEGEDSLRKYRGQLEASEGASKKMAKTIGDSLGNRLKALRSAAIEAGFKFIDAFKDKIPGAIDAATQAVRKFDVQGVVDGLISFKNWISNVTQVIRDLWPVIETAVIFTLAYKAAVKGVLAVQAVSGFMSMTKAIMAAGKAQGFLNAMMIANPIGMVTIAIAGLVTAGVMLYRQWDEIKEIWNFFVNDFDIGTTKIGKAWDNFFNSWFDGIQKIKKWFGFEGIPSVATVQVRGVGANNRALQKATDERLPTRQTTTGRQGLGGGGPERTPPNQADVQAQNINFQGRLEVAGAPPGSKLETKTTGAPPVRAELAGANI